jgi:hypothetical protein
MEQRIFLFKRPPLKIYNDTIYNTVTIKITIYNNTQVNIQKNYFSDKNVYFEHCIGL